MFGARREGFQRSRLEPADQNVECAVRRRSPDDDPALVPLDRAPGTLPHIEYKRPAEERQRFAARALQDGGARSGRPLVQLAEDPAFLVTQERLDIAPGRPQR